jgi:uncharacterized membrane protein required for colicin V production
LSMALAIDIVLVLIVAFSAWRGFKNGFIRGIFGVLAIIIAIYGANLIAKTYSGEFTGMLEPFVGGIVDKNIIGVTDDDTADGEDESPPDDVASPAPDDAAPEDDTADIDEEAALAEPHSDIYDISYKALRGVGISEEAARLMAEKVDGEIDSVGQQLTNNLTEKLCSMLAYIAVFGISFILIAIIFAVIGNVVNLAFSLPGIQTVDKIIGLVMGIARGVLIIFAIGVVVRYLGLVSAGTVEKTVLLDYVVNNNPIANILGI